MRIYMKGADTIILPRINFDNPAEKIRLEEDLHKFACKGLWTLVMCEKEINPIQYEQWKVRYEDLTTSNDSEKEAKL